MNRARRQNYVPSVTLMMALALAALYLGVFLPLRDRARLADVPLKEKWGEFVTAYGASEACAGVTREKLADRVAAMEVTARDLQAAATLVDSRLNWPTQIQALLRQPFQWGEFQNECQRSAEALHKLGGERKIRFEGALTNRLADALGLAMYSADLPDPAMLWARLHATHHVVLAALECNVAVVKALQQLPAISHRSVNGGQKLVEELPLRLEVAGPMPQVARLLATLPLHNSEVAVTGLGGGLTNKPVLFLGQTLLRKSAPAKEGEAPRPGEILFEINVSALVPVPPDTVSESSN